MIQQLSAPELKAMIDGGEPFELVDVRTEWERETAQIGGSRLLDQAYHDHLLTLDKATTLVFQCHHGIRSQAAADYFAGLGLSVCSICAAGSTRGLNSSIRRSALLTIGHE
jgi:monothiol glutaredoxin